MSSSTAPGRLSVAMKRKPISRILLTPKLTALGGWVLSAGALAAMLKFIALAGQHELQYPLLDFGICVVVATLGLSVARIVAAARLVGPTRKAQCTSQRTSRNSTTVELGN